MDDVVSPKIEGNIEYIIGEALVDISRKLQVQLLYLAKEYEQESRELSFLIKILQIW